MQRASASRNHHGLTAAARGYGPGYRAVRSALLGLPCSMRLAGCTGIASTAQHSDDGRLLPACAHCNYADGARRRNSGRTARYRTYSYGRAG